MIREKFKYYCETADKCYTLAATAVLMEVTGYQPWGFAQQQYQQPVHQAAPIAEVMPFCASCGAQNTNGSAFCANCGASLNK